MEWVGEVAVQAQIDGHVEQEEGAAEGRVDGGGDVGRGGGFGALRGDGRDFEGDGVLGGRGESFRCEREGRFRLGAVRLGNLCSGQWRIRGGLDGRIQGAQAAGQRPIPLARQARSSRPAAFGN